MFSVMQGTGSHVKDERLHNRSSKIVLGINLQKDYN